MLNDESLSRKSSFNLLQHAFVLIKVVELCGLLKRFVEDLLKIS